MNEKFLHYVWKYKLFSINELFTTDGKTVEIISSGIYNIDEGADFLNAQLKIDNIIWNGSVEIHIKSSDWNLHKHNKNVHYKNTILHIVYEDDQAIEYLKSKNIPTIELKNYISDTIINSYNNLQPQTYNFIPCEKQMPFILFDFSIFSEQLYIEKLERNAKQITENLKNSQNDWEAVLFYRLAYTFGLKVNAEIFMQIAKNIGFYTIKKAAQNWLQLEAMFFAKANLLQTDDDYSTQLNYEYQFVSQKFKLDNAQFPVKFLRLRPPNFPTIRLSQLANLYHLNQNLFSKVVQSKRLSDLQQILNDVQASSYWNNHYSFGKISTENYQKKLSTSQQMLIIINAFLPIKYLYQKSIEEFSEEIFDILQEIKPEINTITKQFSTLNFTPKNALESQAQVELYTNYCNKKHCLQCKIGYEILTKK